jgi:hypothetical protein
VISYGILYTAVNISTGSRTDGRTAASWVFAGVRFSLTVTHLFVTPDSYYLLAYLPHTMLKLKFGRGRIMAIEDSGTLLCCAVLLVVERIPKFRRKTAHFQCL